MADLLFYAALPWIISVALVSGCALGSMISARFRLAASRALIGTLPDTQIDDEDDQADLERVLKADRERYIAGERPLLLR